jgi:hypothetical protein
VAEKQTEKAIQTIKRDHDLLYVLNLMVRLQEKGVQISTVVNHYYSLYYKLDELGLIYHNQDTTLKVNNTGIWILNT